ncbi:MAG: ATP-binding protein [Deltaproteobacteria bacterium]|nr:ATP-binding protein [Deltaproteobacteria bacterium]
MPASPRPASAASASFRRNVALESGPLLPEFKPDTLDWHATTWTALLAPRVAFDSPAARSAEVGDLKRASPPALADTPGGALAAGRDPTLIFALDPPFCGRRDAVTEMYATMQAALNEGGFRAVWLHGDQGTGKTRLAHHVRELLRGASGSFRWVEVPLDDGTAPPTLAGRMLLRVLGRGERRLPEAYAAIVRRVATWGGPEVALALAPQVAGLLALRQPGDPKRMLADEPRENQGADMVVALLARLARDEPLVVHVWVDPPQFREVVHLLGGMHKIAAAESLVVVVESRAAPSNAGPAACIGLGRHAQADLDREATAWLHRARGVPAVVRDALVATALGSPAALRDALADRIAAGELVCTQGAWRWLREGDVSISASLGSAQALAGRGDATVSAAVAALPADLRAILAAAAVFGEVAWLGGVLAVLRGLRTDPTDSGPAADRSRLKGQLLQLMAIDLVAFSDHCRIDGDYEFRLAAAAEGPALLAALPDDRRRAMARFAAQWLGARLPADDIALAVRHGELCAAGGDGPGAVAAWLRAGTLARAAGHLHRALALFARGRGASGTDAAAVACDVRVALGGGLLRLSRHADAQAVLLEALHLGRCADDDERCGIVRLRLSQVARLLGDYEAALDNLDAAHEHFGALGVHRWIADVSEEVGRVHIARGATDGCKTALQQFLKALVLRRRGKDKNAVARAQCQIARVHLCRGHLPDATDAVREAQDIADQAPDRWIKAEVGLAAADLALAAGDFALACALWDKAARLAQEVGDHRRQLEVALAKVEACALHGEGVLARSAMGGTLDLAREVADPEMWSAWYRVQASLALDDGDLDRAARDADRAVQVVQDSGAGYAAARARLIRGCVLGSRVLTEGGAGAVALDHACTADFDAGLQTLRVMGDLVHCVQGLRSYAGYLAKRGGGPRLAAVQRQLKDQERELGASPA